MNWKEKIKEFGGGDINFLSGDGEVLDFVICDNPILLEGKFKGKPQQRIGIPIVSAEGFSLFITGKRLARKLSKYEDKMATSVFRVVRHGEENDVNSSYPVTILDDTQQTAELFALKDREFNPTVLAEAVAYAIEIMAD